MITYGFSKEAALHTQDISSNWPNRLSFTAINRGQSIKIETQLCGAHWVHSVLAAMAVGEAMGIPLSDAAEAIRNVPPFPGRMSPVTTPDGVTFIRDDCKAPLWTVPASLEFMRNATAKRKIVVVGTLSDYHGNPSRMLPRGPASVGGSRCCLLCYTPQASMFSSGGRHPSDEALLAYANSDQLLEFLRGFLREGDLVLLKGDLKKPKSSNKSSPPGASNDGRRRSVPLILTQRPRTDILQTWRQSTAVSAILEQ